MGYSSVVEGGAFFNRALTPKEARALAPSIKNKSGYIFELIEDESVEEDAERGIKTITTSYIGIRLKYDGHGVRAIGYGWHKALRHLIDLLPQGVATSGEFLARGEEGDQEKLSVSGRSVILMKGVMTFPESEWTHV